MNLYWSVMRLVGNIWYRIERWNQMHSRYDGVTAVSASLTHPGYAMPSTWPKCPRCRSGKTTLEWDLHGVDDFDLWFCIDCQDEFSVTRTP